MKIKTILVLLLVLSSHVFSQSFTACSIQGTITSMGTIYTTSGRTDVDIATNQELEFLSKSFLVRPDFYYYDDAKAMNAFSTKNCVPSSSNSDGTICLGVNLLTTEIPLSVGGTNVAIILAHEFGHTVARKFNIVLQTKQNELFADYLAGGYMFYRNRYFKMTDIVAAMQAFHNMGDNDFTDSTHHGTPESRTKAIQKGYYDCFNKFQNGGATYTLEEGVHLAYTFVTTNNLP